jgi:hypothetical protein
MLMTGCEIEKVDIPRTDALLAMHGVLSASAQSQVILLERTRNGSVYVFGSSFDLADPVVSDEGIAEIGAFVTLTTPNGQTLVASADNTTRGDGKGGGIYRFALPGDALERIGAYRLLVRTSKGETLIAETAVPSGAAAAVAEQRVFDRSRDTLLLEWPAAPGARSYFVRIETPYGPRSFFTDSTRLRLTGELRNIKVAGLPRIFLPGFTQAVTVSAVDSNYYDWYRTQNDVLEGSGLVNRVIGGFGVFGSLVRLRFQSLSVVTPQAEPEAGSYRRIGTPTELLQTPYLSFELYVESHAARADQGDAISGQYEKRLIIGEFGERINGLLGTVHNGRLELALLRGWTARDTVDVFTGEIRGDTIVGSYRGAGGPVRFLKQP